MRKYFIVAATLGGLVVAFVSQPAAAFVANQIGVAQAATVTNGIIEIKRSSHKGTPPGWHHGRKRGWDGSRKPPGQSK